MTVTSDRYDAIQGEADINCTGKVNIRSDKSMAVNGSLNIYDSSEVTLSAGSNVVNGSANITSNGNVAIYSTVGRAAEKLTINNAENVTISIRDAAGAVSGDTKITASGTVTLKTTHRAAVWALLPLHRQAAKLRLLYQRRAGCKADRPAHSSACRSGRKQLPAH